MKGLKVNMNYVSCFLLCVILILMVVCCCKKPTESFGDIKCTKRRRGKCKSYSCLSAPPGPGQKWKSCGNNSNMYCTKNKQWIVRDMRRRVKECIRAPSAPPPASSPPASTPQAVAVAAAPAASSPTPWLELSETELQHADILLNFLTLISGVDFVRIYSSQHLIHEDWQILTESLINNVKLIVNGNRVEDFFEYLHHGQNDPFAIYKGSVLFMRNTFGKNVLTARSWEAQALASNRSPPTEEQEIILNQVSAYMDYWTIGHRGQNYVRPTPTKDVFGNYR